MASERTKRRLYVGEAQVSGCSTHGKAYFFAVILGATVWYLQKDAAGIVNITVIAIIGAVIILMVVGVLAYYRSLCRFRDRGVVVDAKVTKSSETYRVNYVYDGLYYRPRVGMVINIDATISITLEKASEENKEIKLLIDPDRPKRFIIVPAENDKLLIRIVAERLMKIWRKLWKR